MNEKITKGLFKIASAVAKVATALLLVVIIGKLVIPNIVPWRHILGFGVIVLVLWVIAGWKIFSKLKVLKGRKLSDILAIISMVLAGFYFILWIVKLFSKQSVASRNPLLGAIVFAIISIICLNWKKIIKFIEKQFDNGDEEDDEEEEPKKKAKKAKEKDEEAEDEDDEEDSPVVFTKDDLEYQEAINECVEKLFDTSVPFDDQAIATMTKGELVTLITVISKQVVVELVKQTKDSSK